MRERGLSALRPTRFGIHSEPDSCTRLPQQKKTPPRWRGFWNHERAGSIQFTGQGPVSRLSYRERVRFRIDVRLEGATAGLTQAQMAELFQTTVPNMSMHLRNVYAEGELQAAATVKEFLIVRTEGNRQVSRAVEHYNLDAIISAHGGDASSTRKARAHEFSGREFHLECIYLEARELFRNEKMSIPKISLSSSPSSNCSRSLVGQTVSGFRNLRRTGRRLSRLPSGKVSLKTI